MKSQTKWLLSLICVGMFGMCEGKPVEILTSFYPMYVDVLNVAGGVPGVNVTCLTPPYVGCLHDYQLSAGDMKKIAKADIFVTNGAGMESFIEKATKQAPALHIVDASRGIELTKDANPHVWVSISSAIEQVKNIAHGLADADPVHADAYRNHAAEYVSKLEQLRGEMHAVLDRLSRRDIVTFHEAFPYFAREFGLNVVGVVEREPGSEPNARELASTIELVRNKGSVALFAEPQYPAKCASVIEKATGVPVYVLDPVVTGPREPGLGREAYLRAMRGNLDVLKKALGTGSR